MEKNIKIKVGKTHFAYGQLSGSLNKPLVILVHGLCSSMYESLIHDAARWFADHGYSTFRFNLYSWQKGARQIGDCTLKIHASDVDAVVRYFRKRGVKKIVVAGHSYGGPTILLSKDQDFDAAVLWDPSFETTLKSGEHAGKFVKQVKGYFMDSWGVNVVIGKKMVEEAHALNWKALTKNFHVPLKIISAGKGGLVGGAKHYFETANNPKSLDIMKGATHYFDDTAIMAEGVYKLTKEWFDKF